MSDIASIPVDGPASAGLAAELAQEAGALSGLSTPALVVDGATLEANIRRMAGFGADAGVSLRPHAKTHKCAQIARRQLAAGAVGIATATVAEAEALAAEGIGDLLVTTPFMGTAVFARAVALARRGVRLSLTVDHGGQLEALTGALSPSDPVIDVLVDCDVGQRRTGVTSVGAAVGLARTIAAERRLSFAGLQGFAGQAQHLADPDERSAEATDAGRILKAISDALAGEGLAPGVITGSGTGTFAQDAAGPYSELQVGSYVFMDADYAQIVDTTGAPPPFAPSLFVLSTVVSVNRPGEVTIDAGTKSLAFNGPPPSVIVGVPAGSAYRFAGDEHGILNVPDGAPPPELGARVLVGATHCDPTVNLFSQLHVLSESGLEAWPVLARH